jgi:hypothetical protein
MRSLLVGHNSNQISLYWTYNPIEFIIALCCVVLCCVVLCCVVLCCVVLCCVVLCCVALCCVVLCCVVLCCCSLRNNYDNLKMFSSVYFIITIPSARRKILERLRYPGFGVRYE